MPTKRLGQRENSESSGGEAALRAQIEAQAAALKNAEFKMAQLEEQLATSEKLKAQFVATMSHELRTPLNVVLGFGSLLADEAFGALNKDQNEACQKILESSERLAILINDLLDFSRLQASILEFTFAPCDLHLMLEEVIADFKPLADQKGLSLALESPAGMPRLVADVERLRQSVKHLVDNALKFTPAGGKVGIRVHVLEAEGQIVLEVWDTGIGISSEVIHRLFERFYQVDSSNTRLYGGTGIGLSLVKELIERHGGEVSVESTLGKGSTFRLVLPLEGSEAHAKQAGARAWRT